MGCVSSKQEDKFDDLNKANENPVRQDFFLYHIKLGESVSSLTVEIKIRSVSVMHYIFLAIKVFC